MSGLFKFVVSKKSKKGGEDGARPTRHAVASPIPPAHSGVKSISLSQLDLYSASHAHRDSFSKGGPTDAAAHGRPVNYSRPFLSARNLATFPNIGGKEKTEGAVKLVVKSTPDGDGDETQSVITTITTTSSTSSSSRGAAVPTYGRGGAARANKRDQECRVVGGSDESIRSCSSTGSSIAKLTGPVGETRGKVFVKNLVKSSGTKDKGKAVATTGDQSKNDLTVPRQHRNASSESLATIRSAEGRSEAQGPALIYGRGGAGRNRLGPGFGNKQQQSLWSPKAKTKPALNEEEEEEEEGRALCNSSTVPAPTGPFQNSQVTTQPHEEAGPPLHKTVHFQEEAKGAGEGHVVSYGRGGRARVAKKSKDNMVVERGKGKKER